MAVDKASGVLSHPNGRAPSRQALLPWAYDAEKEAFHDGNKVLYLLNRLDSPTSGIMLLADNPEVAGLVKDAFARHVVKKDYVALVKGIPSRKRDEWKDCLAVRKGKTGLRTRVVRGRPNAFCSVRLRETGNGPPARALLTLSPQTGRTHQLRVQCSSRRLPIVGDATYGDFTFNRECRRRLGESRLFLHSWRTRLTFQLGNGETVFFSAESEVPPAFTVALA